MFGGVSETYSKWDLDGEPYKKGSSYYVKVINPYSKIRKEVRWYCDNKHTAKKPRCAFYKCFGLKNEQDKLMIIPQKYLTDDEEMIYFNYNWKSGGKWQHTPLFGGAWIAPEGSPIPAITNKDKIWLCSWADFKREGQRLCGVKTDINACWFE